MRKTRKLLVGTLVSVGLMMSLSMSALAANTKFTADLPKYQMDTEVSTVRKAKDTSYFTITISTIGAGTNAVCAWTEGDLTGLNYSSPYNQVERGTENIDYALLQPKPNENVVLNLDNPVSLNYTVYVTGSWDPN